MNISMEQEAIEYFKSELRKNDSRLSTTCSMFGFSVWVGMSILRGERLGALTIRKILTLKANRMNKEKYEGNLQRVHKHMRGE